MIPLAPEEKSGWERRHSLLQAVVVDDTVTTLSSVGSHARLTWTGALWSETLFCSELSCCHETQLHDL